MQTIVIEFDKPQSIQQKDMLEYLSHLTSKQRTELLGEMYSQWETQRNEQIITEAGK